MTLVGLEYLKQRETKRSNQANEALKESEIRSREGIAAADRTSKETIASLDRESKEGIASLDRESKERVAAEDRRSKEGIASADRLSKENIADADRSSKENISKLERLAAMHRQDDQQQWLSKENRRDRTQKYISSGLNTLSSLAQMAGKLYTGG